MTNHEAQLPPIYPVLVPDGAATIPPEIVKYLFEQAQRGIPYEEIAMDIGGGADVIFFDQPELAQALIDSLDVLLNPPLVKE